MECHFNDSQTSWTHSPGSRFSLSPCRLETRKTNQAEITDETDEHPQQFASASGQISLQISQFVAAYS
jgi:hypothetical protein